MQELHPYLSVPEWVLVPFNNLENHGIQKRQAGQNQACSS
jgi:hypothetical protein